MTDPHTHQDIEDEFRALLASHGMPQPDDVAHLRRAVAFVWYDTKAFVLVDLEELPEGERPFEGFDPTSLLDDPLDDVPDPFAGPAPRGRNPFAETA